MSTLGQRAATRPLLLTEGHQKRGMPLERVALTAPTIHGTNVPVEEPSTASLPDSCAAT